MVSNATRTHICENTGGIDLATYGEAREVNISWIHSSFACIWSTWTDNVKLTILQKIFREWLRMHKQSISGRLFSSHVAATWERGYIVKQVNSLPRQWWQQGQKWLTDPQWVCESFLSLYCSSYQIGGTYLIARAIEATTRLKGFICRCHYLYCWLTRDSCVSDSPPWMATAMTTSLCQKSDKSASPVHGTLVYMSCRACDVLDQCAASI